MRRRDAGIDDGDANAPTGDAVILLQAQSPLAPGARLIGRDRAVGNRHRGNDGKIARDAEDARRLPQAPNALCIGEEHHELVETPKHGKREARCGGFDVRPSTSDNDGDRPCRATVEQIQEVSRQCCKLLQLSSDCKSGGIACKEDKRDEREAHPTSHPPYPLSHGGPTNFSGPASSKNNSIGPPPRSGDKELYLPRRSFAAQQMTRVRQT